VCESPGQVNSSRQVDWANPADSSLSTTGNSVVMIVEGLV
jgi:hypothetical protein